jgi:UDP-glucose 4-epimerase
MLTVCILGGSGFIGTNLIKHLSMLNCQIRIFGRGSLPPSFQSKVVYFSGEFTDLDLLKTAVDGADVVFHLIGSTNPVTAEKDKLHDLKQNIEPTLRLLDLGVSGAYKQIIFLSSGGTVYGVQDASPIHEDSSQWPISTYGVSKVSIERYLHLYHHIHGLDYRIARVSNPFGEHQFARKGQGVVAALIDCALSGKPFQMVGDGSVVRDYIYVEDLVDALRGMLTYNGIHRVFNIGSGIGHNLLDIIQLVECATGRIIDINRLPARPIDVPVNVLDITRAHNELGWTPKIPMTEAMSRTVAWASSVTSDSKAQGKV